MQNEQSLPSTNEITTSVASNVVNQNSNLKNDNCRIIARYHQFQCKRPGYGFICTKKYIRPVLVKECRSKYMIFKNEEAMKRKLRRKNNRDAARKLKAERDNLYHLLKKQVYELKLEQNYVLLQVENLHLYKQYLEIKFQQIKSNNKLNNRPNSS